MSKLSKKAKKRNRKQGSASRRMAEVVKQPKGIIRRTYDAVMFYLAAAAASITQWIRPSLSAKQTMQTTTVVALGATGIVSGGATVLSEESLSARPSLSAKQTMQTTTVVALGATGIVSDETKTTKLRPIRAHAPQTMVTSNVRRPGLLNIGLTCYLNAMIQFVLPLMSEITILEEAGPKPIFMLDLEKILEALKAGKDVSEEELGNFQRSFASQICRFRTKTQNDSGEALRKLIEKSQIFDTQTLKLHISYEKNQCPQCGNITKAIELSDVLTTCPIPQVIPLTLQDIVDNLLNTTVECYHGYHELTKAQLEEIGMESQEYMVRGEFSKTPRVLLLELQKAVALPQPIALLEEVLVAGKKYTLQAVILHDGANPRSGHYRCIAKHGTSWTEFDDFETNQIEFISEEIRYRCSVRVVALVEEGISTST